MRYVQKLFNYFLLGSKRNSQSFIKYLRANGCKVGNNVFFYSPKTTSIDEVRMDWISIGDNTKITQGVTILAHDYSPSVLIGSHNRVVLGGGYYTIIGNNCFLGVNSLILPGCKIGNDCIIGAAAVVSGNIPDGSIVAGNPGKVISTIDKMIKKRIDAYLLDAKRNVKHYHDIHKQYPSTNNLHGFAFLYLERTEENWNKYYLNYLVHDNDPNKIREAFFSTSPIFSSYEDFIDYCSNDDYVSYDLSQYY